jgi:peptide/nickel transport system substrate-binding protein
MPFTAAVAAENILRVLNPKVTSQARAQIATIKHVTAVNKTTLRITTTRATPNLPTALIAVKMTDVKHIADINTTANGTGPYKLKSFVPNQLVDLVANPRYFGPKPKYAEIKIVTYSDVTAAESAFKAGNLDILWDVPPTQVRSVAGGGQVLQAAQPAGAFVWELDTTSPPFNNPLARQALSYAVNRPAILQAAYAGFGLASLANDIVSPRNQYFSRKMPAYSHNLQKASELFTQAGVPKGSTLTYWTIAGEVPEWTTAGEILQSDLAQIGIKLNIVSKDVNTWAAEFYPRGKKYPGLVVPNFLSFPPLPADYSLQWFSGSGTCECNWQPGHVYDQAFLTADSSTNDKARAAAYITMQKQLNKNVPVVIIANTADVSVAQSSIHGVWIQSDGTPHLEGAS